MSGRCFVAIQISDYDLAEVVDILGKGLDLAVRGRIIMNGDLQTVPVERRIGDH